MSTKLIPPQPDTVNQTLIKKFLHTHQQSTKYAVGDGMVGNGDVKSYKLEGKNKRETVYATSLKGAVLVGYHLLARNGEDSFYYKIDNKKYQGVRKNNGNGYSNWIYSK